jgi:hypothetical protein
MTFNLCLLTVLFSDNQRKKEKEKTMKKCLSVLFVLVVLFINNCGGESAKKGTYIASPNGEEEPFVPECMEHTDCYPDHTICVSGTCTGEPQPEILPSEADATIGDNDESDAINNKPEGNGPWGNPNYNKNDATASADIAISNEDSSTANNEDSKVATSGCSSDADCNDNNECTDNFCNNAVCEHELIANCQTCVTADDCDEVMADYWCDDDGNVHTASQPKCVSGVCGQEVIVTDCGEDGCDVCNECATDADCDDADDCTFDNCVDGQCGNTQLWTDECGGEPDMPSWLCETDVECDDNDASTTDVCWVGECFHAAVDFECYVGDSCDDGNGCTSDYCDKGYCIHVGSDGCKTCETQADCNDGNVCTIDSCVDSTLTCSHYDNCLYSGEWKKLICETDADCKGSGLGEYCVYSQSAESGLCQECSNLSDNPHPCPTGEICKWGIVGNFNSLSHYWCQEACSTPDDCDDGDACTVDYCISGSCDHLFVDLAVGVKTYCASCNIDADCYKFTICQDGNLQNWTGECIYGKCEMYSIACPIGCADYALDGCAECETSSDCDDDDNPCTVTSCSGGKCVDTWQVNCNLCSELIACGKVNFCNAEKAGELVEFTGKCLETGVCEVVETSCPKGCTSNKCEYVECIKNIDCKVGQFCNANYECDWQGDLQCTFQCPADKLFAVIWFGNNQTATIDCGTGVLKVSPATLCLWGWANPVFKFNLWNGGDVWSSGGKAVLSCNDEAIKVTPDPNLGTAGVQIVSFTDLTCSL